MGGLIPVLFLRPKDLFFEEEISCPACKDYPELHLPTKDHSWGDEIRNHLKLLRYFLCDIISIPIELFDCCFSLCSFSNMNNEVSRIKRAVRVLLGLGSIVPVLILRVVSGAVILLVFISVIFVSILGYSPVFSLILCSIAKLFSFHYINEEAPLYVMVVVSVGVVGLLFYNLILLFVNFFMLYMSCSFITSVLGFTIVGLVLNADIVTPYAAFFVVVTTNIYLCYSNLQNRYKEVKGMILKWKNELHINSGDPEETIPSKLFWFVCDRVLPIQRELCLMFRNVVFILAFLFLVVYSIVFFGNEYNVSAVFSTIAVFVSGVIPALVLKGLTRANMFVGWEKIKIKREIETAVREFHQGNSGNSLRHIEGSQSHSINNDDTLV